MAMQFLQILPRPSSHFVISSYLALLVHDIYIIHLNVINFLKHQMSDLFIFQNITIKTETFLHKIETFLKIKLKAFLE